MTLRPWYMECFDEGLEVLYVFSVVSEGFCEFGKVDTYNKRTYIHTYIHTHTYIHIHTYILTVE